MPNQFKSYAVVFATAVVLGALGSAYAAETAHPKKDQVSKRRYAPQPDPYVKCAMSLGDGPCAPDPAMRRLNGQPVPGPAPNFGPRGGSR